MKLDKHKAGQYQHTAQELCESQGGHPGLHVPNSPYTVSVTVLWM